MTKTSNNSELEKALNLIVIRLIEKGISYANSQKDAYDLVGYPLEWEVKAIAAVKQCFDEAGYKIPLGMSLTSKTVRMTGAKWYERFEKELKDVDSWRPDIIGTHSVLLAAKRASGIAGLDSDNGPS